MEYPLPATTDDVVCHDVSDRSDDRRQEIRGNDDDRRGRFSGGLGVLDVADQIPRDAVEGLRPAVLSRELADVSVVWLERRERTAVFRRIMRFVVDELRSVTQ